MPQYTVQRGDSFWRIAEQMLGDGRRFAEVAAANGLRPDATIQPGQTLEIPYDQPRGQQGQPPAAQGAAPSPSAPLPRPRPAMPGDPQPAPLPRPRPDPAVRSAVTPLPMPREALGTAGTSQPSIQAPPMASAPLGASVPIPQPGGAGRQYGGPPPLQPGVPGPSPQISAPSGAQVGQPMLPPGGRSYPAAPAGQPLQQVQGIESFLADPRAAWPSQPPPLDVASLSPQVGGVVLPRTRDQQSEDVMRWATSVDPLAVRGRNEGMRERIAAAVDAGRRNAAPLIGDPPLPPDPRLADRAAQFRQVAPRINAQADLLQSLPPQAQALVEMLLSNPRTEAMMTPDFLQALVERLRGGLN